MHAGTFSSRMYQMYTPRGQLDRDARSSGSNDSKFVADGSMKIVSLACWRQVLAIGWRGDVTRVAVINWPTAWVPDWMSRMA